MNSMREAFDEIMADLPDAVLVAVAVAVFVTMMVVWAALGSGA